MQNDAPRWGFPFLFGMIPRFLLIFHIYHRKYEGKGKPKKTPNINSKMRKNHKVLEICGSKS